MSRNYNIDRFDNNYLYKDPGKPSVILNQQYIHHQDHSHNHILNHKE